MFMLKYDLVLICPLLRHNGINFEPPFKPAAHSWQIAATRSEHAVKPGHGCERGGSPSFPHHKESTEVTPMMLEVEAKGSDSPHF